MDVTADLKEGLLTRGFITGAGDWENDEFYDFEPLDSGTYVTYRFVHEKRKMERIKNDKFPDMGVDEKVLDHLVEDELKKYLNFPSFWLRFLATFLFVAAILVVTVVLVMIWSMLILDLVFFSLAIFILKRCIMLFWVVRVAIINKGYFTNLRKEIKKLNNKNFKGHSDLEPYFKETNLEFTLNLSELQLKVKKLEQKFE